MEGGECIPSWLISPQQLFPVCPSLLTCCHSVPFRRFLFPQHGHKPKRICGAQCGKRRGLRPPPTGEQHAETDCDAGMRHRALQSPSARAGRGGGREWRRNGGMDREERRQNDGVAIKYTTCGGERAACCWESALWRRVTAPSLHLFLSYFSISFWKNIFFSLFALFCLILLVFLKLFY